MTINDVFFMTIVCTLVLISTICFTWIDLDQKLQRFITEQTKKEDKAEEFPNG